VEGVRQLNRGILTTRSLKREYVMNTMAHNKTKKIVTIGLFTVLCGVWALTPLWVNPCVSTRLSEDEIEQIHAHPSWENLTLEQQSESNDYYQEVEIPCGAQDLPPFEKLRAATFEGLILDELTFRSLVLRFEMVGTDDQPGAYYFKAYTFFYIPLYRIFAGGSGYMEIDRWPFKTHEGIDIGEWE